MKLLKPSRLADAVPALSWCSGEVPAEGKVDLELLDYILEADFIDHVFSAPRHPLLPDVFRPSRIFARPCHPSIQIASLRLECGSRFEENLVGPIPLAMFLATSHIGHLDLPIKVAGARYRLTLLSSSDHAEKFQFAVHGIVLRPAKERVEP